MSGEKKVTETKQTDKNYMLQKKKKKNQEFVISTFSFSPENICGLRKNVSEGTDLCVAFFFFFKCLLFMPKVRHPHAFTIEMMGKGSI